MNIETDYIYKYLIYTQFTFSCIYVYLHLKLYRTATYQPQDHHNLDHNQADPFYMLVQLVIVHFPQIESHNLLLL